MGPLSGKGVGRGEATGGSLLYDRGVYLPLSLCSVPPCGMVGAGRKVNLARISLVSV